MTLYCRHNGGTEADDIPSDILPQQLQDVAINYYKSKVVVSAAQANVIELTTAQHSCGDEAALIKWKTERRMRITSSNVGKIAKRRKSTPVSNLIRQLLYTTFRGNASTAWGLSQEEASSHQYLKWLREDRESSTARVTINCGLVISTSYPWLAATPDGWVEDPKATPTRGIVKFKNPHSYKDTRINEAIMN